MDNEYVYECKVHAECVTDRELTFWETFALCSTRDKARVFTKGYLIEVWKHQGYVFIKDKIVPYQPGHTYYVEKADNGEKWIITTYVIRRELDSLWCLEEDNYE